MQLDPERYRNLDLVWDLRKIENQNFTEYSHEIRKASNVIFIKQLFIFWNSNQFEYYLEISYLFCKLGYFDVQSSLELN